MFDLSKNNLKLQLKNQTKTKKQKTQHCYEVLEIFVLKKVIKIIAFHYTEMLASHYTYQCIWMLHILWQTDSPTLASAACFLWLRLQQ